MSHSNNANYVNGSYIASDTHPNFSAPIVSPRRSDAPDTAFNTRGTLPAVSDVMPGTSVYIVRQQCANCGDTQTSLGRLELLPSGLRPAEAVLGVYATKEFAQFYLDRAVEEVNRQYDALQSQSPEGASSAAPEGMSADAWTKLREAASSTTRPQRQADTNSEVGYKWVYRKWNVVVSVWVQRVMVDAPPAVALW
eukprot:Rhum_TRINITY_DN8583_c0_g1::Rhum_TRINITY_DN8583_c0_g1_i1::g.28818::m.28818